MAIGDKKNVPWSVNGILADAGGDIKATAAGIPTASGASVETALSNKANAIGTYYGPQDAQGVPDTSTDSTLIVAIRQSLNSELWEALGHSYWAFIWQQFYVERSTSTLRAQLAVGSSGYMATRTYDNTVQAWTPWVSQVTATPPQEYPLPLAAGVMDNRKTYFIKEQNGRTRVHFIVKYQPADTRTVVIGTMPMGYRPTGMETNNCLINEAEGDVLGPGSVEVLDNGTVQVYANKAGSIGATGSIEFTATH